MTITHQFVIVQEPRIGALVINFVSVGIGTGRRSFYYFASCKLRLTKIDEVRPESADAVLGYIGD